MRIFLILFCFFQLVSFNLHAQRKAEAAIKNLYENYPQEKIILSFSKEEYVAGETIFFKTYVLSGYDLSTISTNVYIEFFDRNKNFIDKQIIYLLKGTGEGTIKLPGHIAEDVYFIRAYTKWMQNFSETNFYTKPIAVYNPNSSQKLALKTASWSAEAFPESGTLLNGTANKVAVRLTSESTLPLKWSGQLFEKGTNKSITPVHVYNQQVGLVLFVPVEGREYFIKIEDEKGASKEITLNENKSTGVVIKTRNESDRIFYQIASNNVAIPEGGYQLLMTIHDQLVYSALIKKTTGLIEGKVDTKGFPAGIMQLALLDEKENVIATRLTFIERLEKEIEQPKINFEKLSLDPKGLNVWQIPLDSLTWFSYSIQVQDATSPQPDNFLADIFLTSDFSNKIHAPSWYFDNVNKEKLEALDALLITEKWNRFQWNDLVQNKFPTIKFLPDQYLTYKATVTRGKKTEALQQVNLIFRTKDSSNHISLATTDSSGTFYLPNMMFEDTLKVLYQLNNKKASAKDIKIAFKLLNEFHPGKPMPPVHNYMLVPRLATDSLPHHVVRANENIRNLLILDEKYKMMDEVTIKYKKRNATEELDEKLSSGLFRTGNATIIDFVNENQISALSYMNILEWLRGRVAGFSYVEQDGVLIPLLRNSPVQVFLNEIQTDPSVLAGLSSSDIAMIKIIRNNFVGASGNNGAIAIYTKTGDMPSNNNIPPLPSDLLVGYKKPLQFFSPDYTNPLNQDLNDKRDIIMRQQIILPDTNSTGTIRFYNNNITRSLRVIITGITYSGKPVYLNKIIASGKKED